MLDLGFVRENLEALEVKLRGRGGYPAALLVSFHVMDESRREAITAAEQTKAQLNKLSQQMGALKKSGQDDSAVMDVIRDLKKKMEGLNEYAAKADKELRDLLIRIPNLTRDEVPIGKSEADNLTVKTWGEIPTFPDGFTPKPHW